MKSERVLPRILKGIPPKPQNVLVTTVLVSTPQILEATEKVFDIDFDPFSTAPRTRTRQKATTVAIALISELQGFSLTEIGERLNRDHASIHHHLKKFRSSAELKAKAISVKNILGIYT